MYYLFLTRIMWWLVRGLLVRTQSVNEGDREEERGQPTNPLRVG